MKEEQIQRALICCRQAEEVARHVADTGSPLLGSAVVSRLARELEALLDSVAPDDGDAALWLPRLTEALCMCQYARGQGPPPASIT